MELYVIRHCQSENNALWARTGSSQDRVPDPGLTDIGHQQARRLADFLVNSQGTTNDATSWQALGQNRHGYAFSHLYSSLMQRSIVTGKYLAQSLNIPLVAWEDIHERGGIYAHGEEEGERIGLPGPTRAELLAIFDELVLPEGLYEAGWWNRPYESVVEAQVRAERFLNLLLERHGNSDDKVAIITHGGFFQSLLGAVFDFSPMAANLGEETPRAAWIAMHNASISRIDFYEDAVALLYLNRVDFLPEALVT